MTDGTETARQKKTPENGGKKRLRQLLICVVLFGAVFAGRGIDLEPVSRLTAQVGALVQSDTDFQEVFAQLEDSLSGGTLQQTLRTLWTGEEAPPEEAPPAEEAPAEETGEAGR